MRSAYRSGTMVSLTLVALTCLGPPAAAQQFEPLSRHPDVRVPIERMRRDAGPGLHALRSAAAVRTDGEFPLLVIPALFEDSPEPTIPATELQETVFGTTGRTLTTFYQEMSAGVLTVHGEVSEWVRTDVTVLEGAGEVDGHGFVGERRLEHFAAAVHAADSLIDYSQYDNDGPDGVPNSGDDDGYVDALTFKFTEVAGSCGGPGFWPHRASLRDPETGEWGVPTADTAISGEPIRALGYTTESVIECDGETPQGPNVMSHEFGHILGLPDFYRAVEGIEAVERHWMIGCFGLMAAGSWGCGDAVRVIDFGPSGLSPLSRAILGWASPVEAGDVRDAAFELRPVQTSGDILKVQLSAETGEYLLVEYRPATGFDDALPSGGVLVYHVDPSANIFGGAYAETFPYWLLEADGSGALRRTLLDDGDRGVAGDVFARNGAVDSITPATTPSTALASGQPSTVWLRDIRVEDGVAKLTVTTVTDLAASRVAGPEAAPVLEPLELRFAITGGSAPYEAIAPPGGMPHGFSIAMDGRDVVVTGTPLEAGVEAVFPFHVRDSAGDELWFRHAVEFEDVAVSDSDLMDALLAPTAGNQDLRAYLDRSGNADGALDLGDVRAYFGRTGYDIGENP